MKFPRLVVIVGETGSGKSSLAHLLALENNGEIICADSRTVYKGMDIGTAKPTKAEQAEAKYHLLDVVESNEIYNAARFQTDANQAIQQISSAGKLPIMVGGTGLFIDSVLFDFDFGHVPNSELRAKLSALTLDELRVQALVIDENLDSNTLSNKRRLIRLIEVGEVVEQQNELRKNTIVLGLKIPKNELRKRIEQRTELMFRQGLRKEVDELVDEYGWDSEAMSGIGYREFQDYSEGKLSMTQVKNSIVKNTLNYAKRQRTWFKRNPHIEWFEDPVEAKKSVDNFLTTGQ